jgi:hypothetical protein
MLMDIVGRCERCGREFVLLPQAPLIDRYPPQGTTMPPHIPGKIPAPAQVCGGRVVLCSDISDV